MQFRVTAIFMELNMENIIDLFADSKEAPVPLQIREDTNQGVFVEGVAEKVIKNKAELLAVIKRGARSRFVTGKPGYRTHAVLQIFLEQRWSEKDADGIKVRPIDIIFSDTS